MQLKHSRWRMWRCERFHFCNAALQLLASPRAGRKMRPGQLRWLAETPPSQPAIHDDFSIDVGGAAGRQTTLVAQLGSSTELEHCIAGQAPSSCHSAPFGVTRAPWGVTSTPPGVTRTPFSSLDVTLIPAFGHFTWCFTILLYICNLIEIE